MTNDLVDEKATIFRFDSDSEEYNSMLPENYYCKWSIPLDRDYAYILSLKRSRRPSEEELSIELYSQDNVRKVDDRSLAYKGSGRNFDQYVIE